MGEAKTRLSELVDRAAKGETFLIAKAGKAVVKLTAIDRSVEAQRLGFLAGEIFAPEDFDRMGRGEIDSWFATRRHVRRAPRRRGDASRHSLTP